MPKPASETRLSAIVLAAGESTRFGSSNKLLYEIDGQPLVRRTVATVAACPFVELVVVTGHQADEVERALSGVACRLVHNSCYRDGQATSVRAGLDALEAPSDGVMICLADQPKLETQDIAALRKAFAEREGKAVVVPTHRGRRGNPIVIDRVASAEILDRGGSFGCRHFIERNSDLVLTVAMRRDAFVTDLDRPEDFEAFESDRR